MKKQLIDQLGHFVVGWSIVGALSLVVSFGVALSLLMSVAVLRELHQHRWDTNDLKQGSVLDLTFFLLGGIMWV
jgi:O-antigen/teichoic acid export membrane protein